MGQQWLRDDLKATFAMNSNANRLFVKFELDHRRLCHRAKASIPVLAMAKRALIS
jgi:hypothetical protein